MRRRQFIAALSSAVAWPLAARAQQTAAPVIGFLSGGSPAGYASPVVGFRHGLNETGFIEGRNVAIDYRWVDGQFDQLPEAANDLVRRRVAVIFASGGVLSATAAKEATSTIPIVFAHGADPIKFGHVASFNHPGGNVTGVSFLANSLEHKRLELLREMVAKESVIAALLNPNNPNAESQLNDLQAAARTLGQPIVALKAATDRDLEAALAALVRQQVNALAVAMGARPPTPLPKNRTTRPRAPYAALPCAGPNWHNCSSDYIYSSRNTKSKPPRPRSYRIIFAPFGKVHVAKALSQ